MRRFVFALGLLSLACRSRTATAPDAGEVPAAPVAAPAASALDENEAALERSLRRLEALRPQVHDAGEEVATVEPQPAVALAQAPSPPQPSDPAIDGGRDEAASFNAREAKQAIAAGDAAAAVAALTKALNAGAPAHVVGPAAIQLSALLLQMVGRGQQRDADEQMEELLSLSSRAADVSPWQAAAAGEYAYGLANARQRPAAIKWADRAIALAPQTPRAWEAKALALWGDGDVDAALDVLGRAVVVVPHHRGLEQLKQRYETETRQEGRARRLKSEHFFVSVDGELRDDVATQTLSSLEEAFRLVAQPVYGYAPPERVGVVLYPNQVFATVKHTAWSAGFFDGRVKLATGGADGQSLGFKQILFHEYGHAVFASALGTAVRTAPAWLNEGLAERAGATLSALGTIPCAQAHLVTLAQLEQGFGRLPSGNAHLAYITAQHAADRLNERFSTARVHELIAKGRALGDVRAAFEPVLGVSYQRFVEEFDHESR